MMKKVMKLFWVAFFVGLICSTSLRARQIVTVEDREWAKEALSSEKDLAASVSPNTIAVLNFNNITELQELNPVEKGMAIMLISDLAKLERFQIVERARMQALIDELVIAEQGVTAPETTARLGKMLGAERVVGGDILMLMRDTFKLNSNLLEVPTESITGHPQAQGELLAELFKMEKELLFEIIAQLKITPTPEEEEKLKKNLTDNLQAFLYLIEGLEHSDKGNNLQALESFENAGTADPGLTLADQLINEILTRDIKAEKAAADSARSRGLTATFVPASPGSLNISDKSLSVPHIERNVDRDNDGYTDNLDCDDSNPGIHPGAADNNCDGMDNDCSGIPDDGYISMPTNCGTGACAAAGVTSCVNGAVVDSCVPGAPSADDNCNGIDENCNGLPDDGYVTMQTECGTGACTTSGATSCVNGSVVDSCTAGTPSADDNCNGIDENCNGVPDDSYVSQTTECGTGACASNGVTSCVNGAVVDSCIEGTPTSDANCNGVDENCNGTADDDYVGQMTTCGTGSCVNTVETRCTDGLVFSPSCEPLFAATPEVCNDGIDNDCDYQTDENCDLIPPLVSIGSIDAAHENIFTEPGLNGMVDNGDFYPGDLIGSTEGQALTEAFFYAFEWGGTTTKGIYSVTGSEYNDLELETVEDIADQTLGLQTLGVDDGFPIVRLPEGVLEQINNDPFLAYAVQVEEDTLNQQALTLHKDAANERDNVPLYNDINKVLRNIALNVQSANYIKARDAFLLQKEDAQAGRVLRDREGILVRTQQYILRPSEKSVQMISVSLRGTGPNAGLTTIDWRTDFEEAIPEDLGLQYLDWDDWLFTEYGNRRYINNETFFYDENEQEIPLNLSSMSITFATDSSYIKHARSFMPKVKEIQVIDTETLELQSVSPYDGLYRYVVPWDADPTEGEFYLDNFVTVGGEINREDATSPTGFSYYGVRDGQQQKLLTAWFYVLGDYYNEPPPQLSFNGTGGPFGFLDIWHVMMVNENSLNIGPNNLEIAFFAPGTSPLEDDAIIDAVYIPMNRMVWNRERTD